MTECNLSYSSDNKDDLYIDLMLLYDQMDNEQKDTAQSIAKEIQNKYSSIHGNNVKIDLAKTSNLEGASKAFYDDVIDIVYNLSETTTTKLPKKANNFKNYVLSAFFELDNSGQVATQVSEDEQSAETDEEQQIRKLQTIEEALLNIYGPNNIGLIGDVTDTFGRELRRKLIYDEALKTKHQLTTQEINDRIMEYKNTKFLSILNYLKTKYPNDSELQNIEGMYSHGILDSRQYYYVLEKFKQLVLNTENRNDLLNEQLADKIQQKNKKQQEASYKNLINIIKNNEALNKWFNGKYSTHYTNSQAQQQLFLGGRFSDYYLQIKNKLLGDIKKGILSADKQKILEIIHDIENPNNDLLNYVNDYIMLTQFDDLLSHKLGSNIGIEKGFLNNVEPQKQTAQKYKLRESHQHQKAGWETANNEGSEAHTSATVKDMLDTIFIYKYNESNQPLSQTIDMTSLMQAWQALISDVLNGEIHFDFNNSTEVETTLKNLINTQSDNVIDTITGILEVLYKPYKISHSRGRMIDAMKNEHQLSEQHKNILYSFYNEVLNKENSGSSISIETAQVNNNLKIGNSFYDTVSELCAVLYRNVNNNYIDCNLQRSKSAFTIKQKFNWDAALFDSVDRILLASKNRQTNKIVDKRLAAYEYESINPNDGTYRSTVKIKYDNTNSYTFGFRYKQDSSNVEGLFSDSALEVISPIVVDNNNQVSLLDVLAEIDIRDFRNKLLSDSAQLKGNEVVFKNLLDMFDYYLGTNFLSDKGLEILSIYKYRYKADSKSGLHSNNYLTHFLKLAIRTADIDNQVMQSGDQSMRDYLKGPYSKYGKLFERESKKPFSDIFEIQANRVYFKPVTTKDPALNALAKYEVEVSGKSMKSTSLNKAGASVSNYSISRLGSELNRRLYEQKGSQVANTLLFVNRPDAIDVDPVIDSEVVTLIGDVKAVKDMSSSELFQHAILDKFYTSFLQNGKICFQPTVYSDKTNFLNYLVDPSKLFDNQDIMKLMEDTSSEFIDTYKNTFFAAHNKIYNNIVTKIDKLMKFAQTTTAFTKTGDVYDSTSRLYNVSTFLRNRTEKELMDLVYAYNINNEEKIELEKDKDYRSYKGFCDLNEIVKYYVDLFSNRSKLEQFLNRQQQLFIENLKDQGVSFQLFNSVDELKAWTGNTLNENNQSLIVKILSNTKLLNVTERKAFAENWIDAKTGELILEKDGRLNPFLEKFFYLEGLFSNNLRLSLSGTEINHPDKAFDTVFNQIKSAIKTLQDAEINGDKEDIKYASEVLRNLINKYEPEYFNNYTSMDIFIGEFSTAKTINDLANNANMQNIYNETIIEIINTAQGTQFKRNVIIPATLQHPVTGLINGVANKVNVAVIYDMKAPVNNLRESDSIDSQDGSAWMSPIQVILENNSLGDQRVGTNRKPIWDAQTGDLTSFLAKFAAFGQTNAMMLQSLQSNSAQYNMFKKMHNIRWNGSVDLTKNINQVQTTIPIQKEVSRWFRNIILENQKLYYKNKFGDIVQITDFGRDADGYYTMEVTGMSEPVKVHHYFNENSEHFTTKAEGLHSIDSLYELFIALGGINCVNSKGVTSEFSNQVLTNFVINVGYKHKPGNITSINDVAQPLKSKFVGYSFNNTGSKNGAKNINSADTWTNDAPLNTFELEVKGLGIQLNADHDVVDSELTEFSQVVAACAAYGKDYKAINEIYYSLAESAFQASKEELTNIQKFFNDYAADPDKAKYQLYKIVGRLIVQSKSNSDMDLTEKLKQEINKEFKINKDNSSKGLKIPFSDPSIYTQFITNITSVINAKSIKRKHPGSGYVMAPGYNVVQYYQVYDSKTGKYKKYLFNDILNKARYDFKQRLRNILEEFCAANGIDPEKYPYNNRDVNIKYLKIQNLIDEVITKVDTTNLNIPYLNITAEDTTEYNKQLVNAYLNIKQQNEQARDKSWFMPTDIVQIINANGTSGGIMDLSDMKTYYDFKNRQYPEGTTFKLCVTKTNNLKPSLIRWQYADANGVARYMTIYDHPIIRNSWNLEKSQRPKQAQIQAVLDLLATGKFEMNGQLIDIIPGSLENTEAELVLGNMYKDTFQTGDSSLAEIMDRGADFFKRQVEVPPIPPGFYNLAFVKNNGQHTLISFSNLHNTENIYEDPFDYTTEYVNDDNEIYTHEGGIKIGKYIKSNWKFINGKVLNQNNDEIDASKYKLIQDKNGNVQEVLQRVEYIKRYKYNKAETVNGEIQLINYTLYNVVPIEQIRSALDSKDGKDVYNSAAYNQVSTILKNIYEQDKYIDIQVNTMHIDNTPLRQTISNSLKKFGEYQEYDQKSKKWVEKDADEIKQLPRFEQHMIAVRKALLDEDNYDRMYKDERKTYYENLAQYKKQYASFLTSQHFISSRIPAQSLQSFMPMTCIGWTSDTSNTAYVSYIQTYLQGSDYDIDKAYIMGQSFSDDGLYIGWSSLFDYSSEEMLDASKTLPLPRGYTLTSVGETQYSIDNELNEIIELQDNGNKVESLRKLANLIYKIDSNAGKYTYNVDTYAEEKAKLITKIQKHEKYQVNYRQREQAYKNVASANIRNVVHNIRNRDQAYSPITMRDLQREAGKSPKGAKTKQLNMMNPLTKYIMQNQNLVGKNVIGIAANGEKDWFNLTYYYHNILRTGNEKDKFYLKMNHSYSRIAGRASGNPEQVTVNHIPDLWNADAELAAKLKEQFYTEFNDSIDTNDKYVDQLISQILSAATDNAKELILAKINAGTNLAKYHLHLIMMGFNLQDIIAFMTSPVVELVDKYSRNDLYKNQTSSVTNAMKVLNGIIDLSKIAVRPSQSISQEAQADMADMAESAMDMAEAGVKVKNTDYIWIINKIDKNLYKEVGAKSLQDFIQKYIKAKTTTITDESTDAEKKLYDYTLPETDNLNTNYVFKYVQQIINDINEQIATYNQQHPGYNYTIKEFDADLAEFFKITDEANETSTLASVWLKLNQGIPQTDIDLIKLIKRMNGSVTTRERKMGIKKPKNAKETTFVDLSDSTETEETTNTDPTTTQLLKQLDSFQNNEAIISEVAGKSPSQDERVHLARAILNIKGNNNQLQLEEIIAILRDAIQCDLYGNFDLYKFLKNENVAIPQTSKVQYNSRQGDAVSYREAAATYYNLIKSSWNILDLVNRIPHYKMNLDLLNYTLQQRHLFANKSKIVDQLLSLNELSYSALTDKDYKNIIAYADKILITSYFLSQKDPIDISKVANAKVFNASYDLVQSEELYINTLNGIDSLKNFVENEFYEWLKDNYRDNFLVKELIQSSNRGKSMLRTTLNLFDIDQSLANQQTYNKYLIAVQQLAGEKFDANHTVADILMLYNLAVNGTKLGGKYMTGIFRDSVREGTVLYDYYKFMSEQDYSDDFEYIKPTRRDFLIAMAPTVYSMQALKYRTEPYVKVVNSDHGYDVYKRYYDKANYTWKYNETSPETLLQLNNLGLTKEEIDERLYNYSQNSLVMFPELHKRFREKTIFEGKTDKDMENKAAILAQYIRQNRLLIYKLC